MYTYGSNDGILLSVNNADVRRRGVNDVDFVSCTVCCNAGRFAPHTNRFCRLKGAQVDYGDRIALTIGDIGVLAVGRTVIANLTFVEVPPAEADENWQQNSNDEELLQDSGAADPKTD